MNWHRRRKGTVAPDEPPVPDEPKVHPNFVAFGEQSAGLQFHVIGTIHLESLSDPTKVQPVWYHTGFGPPRPFPEHKQEDDA